MYRKGGHGHVLICVPATHKEGTGIRGADGKEIIIDIAFNPIRYVINYAEVFLLPLSMGKTPMFNLRMGSPGYGPIRKPNTDTPASMDIYAIGGVYQYRFSSDIVPEVNVGDRIYFKRHTLNNAKNKMGALKSSKSLELLIFRVPYDSIYCSVRDGQIKMIGGWVLLEPIYEDWDSIFKPTYFDYTTASGEKIPRPKKDWIQIRTAPTHDNQRAKVAHIGTPLKGDTTDIEVGDVVLFKRQPREMEFQEIEGKKYIILHQSQIMAQFLQECKIE